MSEELTMLDVRVSTLPRRSHPGRTATERAGAPLFCLADGLIWVKQGVASALRSDLLRAALTGEGSVEAACACSPALESGADGA